MIRIAQWPRLALVVVLLLASHAVAGDSPARNFAVGGATSDDTSAVSVADPVVAGIVAAAGLEVQGLSQQLELAIRTQARLHPRRDIVSLFVGGNDYLFFGSDPAAVVGRISTALERLYTELGARQLVVFNLLPIGQSPIVTLFPPGTGAALDAAARAHNALLSDALDAFETAHPPARIVRVDTAALFGTLSGPPFTSPSPQSCVGLTDFASPDPIPLPPQGCGAFVFMDGIHLTSSAIGVIAQGAADAIQAALPHAAGIRNVYSFGDSFADTGSLRDTVLRANLILGNPPLTAPNPPAYVNGRFADGPNLIDQLEAALGARPSTFFPQPLRLVIPLGRSGHLVTGSSRPSVSGSAFVPRSVPTGATSSGPSFLSIDLDGTVCAYVAPASSDSYRFVHCTGGARPGDLVDFATVEITASRSAAFVVELLYYER